MWQDVRYASRTLWRSPGFSVLAIIVLALTIGANAAIFSIVNALLIRPLPVRAPDELTFVYSAQPMQPSFVTYEQARGWAGSEVFSETATTGPDSSVLGTGLEGTDVAGEVVSSNYFSLLGVGATSGRVLSENIDDHSETPAIVISDRLWRRYFESDPNILGRPLRLGSRSWPDSGWRYVVVGVMAPEFKGVTSAWTPTDYWISVVQRHREDTARLGREFFGGPFSQRTLGLGTVIGRRRTGISHAQAESFVSAQRPSESSTRGSFARAPLVALESRRVGLPLDEQGRIAPDRFASALFGLAGVVLLVGVVNLVGVSLARGTLRAPEIALRLSIGAGRGRIARQLLIEGLFITTLAAVGGLLLSRLVIAGLLAGLQRVTSGVGAGLTLDVPVDVAVVGFTALIVVAVGLCLGLAPLRLAFRTNLLAALAGASSSGSRRGGSGWRRAVLIPQVAGAAALLFAAAVAIQFLLRVAMTDPGYAPTGTAYVSFGGLRSWLAGEARLTSDERTAKQELLFRRALDNALASPVVVDAALGSSTPLGGSTAHVVLRDGFNNSSTHHPANHTRVSVEYFRTMGVPVRFGRIFDRRDRADAPRVAAIDERLAARLWPGKTPIGLHFAPHSPGSTRAPDWLEVVGVVGNVRHPLSEGESVASFYTPVAQDPQPGSILLIARGRGTDAELIRALREAVADADSDVEVSAGRTLQQSIDRLLYPRRMGATLLVLAGALALGLAGLGLYGIVGFSVAQRTKELGIRAVLGARPGDLRRLVLREGIVVTAVGLVIGLLVSYLALGVVSSFVFAMPDPAWTLALPVSAILVGVIMLACYVPAYRASRVDPLRALRYE